MMNRKASFALTLIALGAVLLMSSAVARADSLNLSLLSPVTGYPGNTLSVTGTIVAPTTNSGVVYLNSDALTLSGSFLLDDSPFILNAPLTMAPGTTYTAALFNVTILPAASEGTYTGFFTILGGDGSNPSALNALSNTASFDVRVVPEPTTVLVLGAGLAGLAASRRRKRRHVAS